MVAFMITSLYMVLYMQDLCLNFKTRVTIIFYNIKLYTTFHGPPCGFFIFDVVENCRQMCSTLLCAELSTCSYNSFCY